VSRKGSIGLALLLGGLGALVVWQRRKVADLARTAAQKAEEIRRMAGGGISQTVIERFRKYRIGEILERHRGELPWALAAAIVEAESSGDPGAYNYPAPGGVYLRGTVTPGTPPPENAHAVGLFQILTRYTRDKAGDRGYDVTIAQLTDPDANARAALKVLRRLWARVTPVASGPVAYALLYYGHNQGGGSMDRVIEEFRKGATSFAEAARRAGAKDRHVSYAQHVASRVPMWEKLEAELSGRKRLVA